jgi:hypothetical protein
MITNVYHEGAMYGHWDDTDRYRVKRSKQHGTRDEG